MDVGAHAEGADLDGAAGDLGLEGCAAVGREAVDVAAGVPLWRREVLCDPQTSGGLLIAAGLAGAFRIATGLSKE